VENLSYLPTQIKRKLASVWPWCPSSAERSSTPDGGSGFQGALAEQGSSAETALWVLMGL